MDFHSLARRDLQALCKLNAIPANITNVAMADALASLDIVQGLEDFLNRSPERKAVTAAKIPRTGRRTTTQSKPIGDGSESVQPMTMSTRRTARRGISDEIMAESKTPAVRSSRKTVELAKIEDEGKKDVTDTPALATYSRRNQVARKSSVKEVSTVQRAYSTRRSARLTENIDVEEKEEKIDSLVSELSRIDLEANSDNKSLSGGNDAEVVLEDSVEKLDVVALETVNNLEDSEALDEVKTVQEDSTENLVIEHEKEGEIEEEVVDEVGEKLKQLDEIQFVTNSMMIKDEDNKVLGYPMDTENSHEEAAPESGMELKDDDAKEIVVDELKEKSEQCFITLDDSHFVHEVNANIVMTEDEEDSKVEKSLMDSDNLESVVIATAALSAGCDSDIAEEHMTYSEESEDGILNNDDQAEDEMDSEKSFLNEVEPSIGESEVVMTCLEESKADALNDNYPKEIATATEISFVGPFVASDGEENKPVTKTPSVKGLNCVSDDKENLNHNGTEFEPTDEMAKKNQKIELNAKSLRELSKMLKEKLQITNNTADEIGKVTKERQALQKLEDNCQRLI